MFVEHDWQEFVNRQEFAEGLRSQQLGGSAAAEHVTQRPVGVVHVHQAVRPGDLTRAVTNLRNHFVKVEKYITIVNIIQLPRKATISSISRITHKLSNKNHYILFY